MLSSTAYIIDAGWLFLAAWTVALLALNAIAFGKDLFQHGETASSLPVKSRLSSSTRPGI